MRSKIIKQAALVGWISLASLFNVAHAGLITGELDGVGVVYDEDTDLTWLQDVTGFAKDKWDMTLAAVADLTVGTAGDWRVFDMLTTEDAVTSELSNLFANSDFADSGFIYASDVSPLDFWSATSFVDDQGVTKAYFYRIEGDAMGHQSVSIARPKKYTWALHEGDIAGLASGNNNESPVDVPEPSTFAIFALGLLGLTTRRFKA
jgi:hypothetical protein